MRSNTCVSERKIVRRPMWSRAEIKNKDQRNAFMVMVIPKGYESAAPDAVSTAEAVAKMME